VVPDQPALPGLLNRVRDLGLCLISAHQHSRAASGLETTSFKHGHRGRVAVLSTVAVAWTNAVLAAAGQQAPSPFALTEGYRSAFAAAAGFTVLGLIAALLLPGRPRAGRAGTHQALSVPGPGATRPTHERGQGD